MIIKLKYVCILLVCIVFWRNGVELNDVVEIFVECFEELVCEYEDFV